MTNGHVIAEVVKALNIGDRGWADCVGHWRIEHPPIIGSSGNRCCPLRMRHSSMAVADFQHRQGAAGCHRCQQSVSDLSREERYEIQRRGSEAHRLLQDRELMDMLTFIRDGAVQTAVHGADAREREDARNWPRDRSPGHRDEDQAGYRAAPEPARRRCQAGTSEPP